MSINELLEQALTLNVNERTRLIDELFKSIDKPDEEIDQIWVDEANKRLEESYLKSKGLSLFLKMLYPFHCYYG